MSETYHQSPYSALIEAQIDIAVLERRVDSIDGSEGPESTQQLALAL
jgi:hypothetical protein